MISDLVVLQSLSSDVIVAAKERVMGTISASILSGISYLIFGYSYLTIFIAVALSAFCMSIINKPNAIRIATSTAAVITGYGFINPDYSYTLNAVMRSVDTIIGVCFSVLFVLLSYVLHIRRGGR